MPDSVITQDKDGAEYEFESAAIAKRARPDAKIVRFAATGEPYKEGTKASAPANPLPVLEAGGEIAPHVDESSSATAKPEPAATAPKEKA